MPGGSTKLAFSTSIDFCDCLTSRTGDALKQIKTDDFLPESLLCARYGLPQDRVLEVHWYLAIPVLFLETFEQ